MPQTFGRQYHAMLCYGPMLCYGMCVMLCYVHCADCRFYGGARGTRRATARGRIGERRHAVCRLAESDLEARRRGRRNMRTAAKAGPSKYPSYRGQGGKAV